MSYTKSSLYTLIYYTYKFIKYASYVKQQLQIIMLSVPFITPPPPPPPQKITTKSDS